MVHHANDNEYNCQIDEASDFSQNVRRYKEVSMIVAVRPIVLVIDGHTWVGHFNASINDGEHALNRSHNIKPDDDGTFLAQWYKIFDRNDHTHS